MIAILWNFVIKMTFMALSLFFAFVAGCLGLCLFLRSVLPEEEGE
mgnify:CR=1 FL=1